ncbi:LAETG motif-containing sortase-dependent surface protein [Kitasatospora sp. NPDC058965]|uniref:LAETG motif-containing sortase-dependent surface protein n=1 Tax=Kitasatospora sp. NPDC058965 TaxID=3346682 RepID=UPI0036CDFEF9
MARQGRISGRTLAGATVLAVVGVGVLSGTAWAHKQAVTSTCTSATVDLTDYNGDVTNTVTVIIDGKTLVDKQTFGTTFKQTFQVAAHDKPLTGEVDVLAGDDLKGHNGWTGTWPITIPVCPPPPSPSPSPTPTKPAPSPTPTPTPTPTTAPPTVKPTSKAPSPSPTGPQLASTGGGSNAGLIAGIGVGVLVVGGGLVFVSRRRPNRH